MFRIFERRHALAHAFAAAAAGILIGPIRNAPAQEDLSAPPRLSDDDARPAPVPPEAAPDGTDGAGLEEIVVVSDQNPWRLPDLGSAWRAQHEQERDGGRIRTEFLPIWDPEAREVPTRNPFSVTDDIRRVGFIEVFRIRFGGR